VEVLYIVLPVERPNTLVKKFVTTKRSCYRTMELYTLISKRRPKKTHIQKKDIAGQFLQWGWISIFLLLTSCTPPIYQNTTYDIDEFMADSCQIAQGKQAILEMENDENCLSENHESFEEVIIDGDELSIVLYYPQRPDRVAAIATINDTTGFKVCNGKISLPQLPSIDVEGFTIKEVREKLQLAYCNQLPHAQIFVNFKKHCERYVQIIGATSTMIPVDGHMRLSEVLAKAQIPHHSNLFKSYVMRDNQQLPVDLYKLIHEGDERQNIIMRRNDQIFIANERDATVMVTGEVPYPIVIPIRYGFLSIREALVMAGGIPFTGSKCYIQVIRGDFIRPKIYCLAWKDITHLPNQSLLLMPGDVVVISEKPITEWNRFINQMQPSVSSMQNTYNTYEVFKNLL
jgi:polysaccharide biosynthesis/export protein